MLDPDSEPACVLPLGYYVDFLRFLRDHRDAIEVVTYRDLAWPEDAFGLSAYRKEYARWLEQRDPRKVHLLIQHDVDAQPERTHALLRQEAEHGVRSNVMIFRRRVDRQRLARTGELGFTEYPVDDALLRELEARGFVIGYHSNAYEAAGFDLAAAERVFEEDVTQLRSRFRIEHFSPHGGVGDAHGRSNAWVPVPQSLRGTLRWVHNRRSPVFAATYSDGGWGAKSPKALDLARFARSWAPGMRYRVLVHPQYYGAEPAPVRRLQSSAWYAQALARSGEGAFAGSAPAPNGVAGRVARAQAGLRTLGSRAAGALRERWLGDMGPIPVAAGERAPLFVRALSRSGGTLVVTLLDAHPDIAMSYELYPHLLEPHAKLGVHRKGAGVERAIVPAWQRVEARLRNVRGVARLLQHEDLRLFFVRSARSGLSEEDVARLYQQHLEEGHSFDHPYGRLRFMELCCATKMLREGKRRWGLKCSDDFADYHHLWPDACFINVIRDGRDVLASQSNTGAFDADPARVGARWAALHMAFRQFAEQPGVRAYELSYEKLALDPEPETRKLCAFLGMAFDPAMLAFHRKDLTIFQADHLSMNRLVKPIDPTQIGRWKRDLSEAQLQGFYSTAREAMETFGYV